MQGESSSLQKSEIPGRVLLVEDDTIIAINAEMMLLQIGVVEVKSAGTVAEALALMEEGHFDFGVLDFSLGDENSLEIAERFCTANIPLLITTGYVEVDLPPDCKNVPILRKPYRLADLKRMVLSSWR